MKTQIKKCLKNVFQSCEQKKVQNKIFFKYKQQSQESFNVGEEEQKSLIKMLEDEHFKINSYNNKGIDFDQFATTQPNLYAEKYYPKQQAKNSDNHQFIGHIVEFSHKDLAGYKNIDPSLIRESKVIKHVKMRNLSKLLIFQPLRIEDQIHISVDKNTMVYKVWQACCQNIFGQQLFQVTDTY